jgi:DNA polymerase-3 subunit chi
MTRIDFYVLESYSRSNRYQLACRIAHKAYQAGNRAVLHTSNQEEARHLNRLLWVFNDQSFVPHGLLTEADPALNPVLVGDASENENEHDVLINLDLAVPTFFSRYERLAECVDHDDASRQASRERYKFYRDRGYPLHLHKLK